jgi:hypothetical protein
MLANEDYLTRLMTSTNPYLIWIVLLAATVLCFWGLISLYQRIRTSPTKGRKLTLKERLSRRKVHIFITGDRRRNPDYVTMTIQNYGIRPVDLHAPRLVFKRWSSERKFRINSFGGMDDFPMWLEPGYETAYKIQLNQFYDRVPALRRACRLSTEIREVSGKKFVSQTIRIKLI